MVKHLVEVRNKYSESELAIIGFNIWEKVKGEDRTKLITKYIEDNKMNYSVVLGEDSTTNDYAVKGVPNMVVLDADGKIAWQGHPSQMDKVVEEQVKLLRQKKAKAIADAVKDGTFEIAIGKGKGRFFALSAGGEGWTVYTVAGKTLTISKDGKEETKDVGDDDAKALKKSVTTLTGSGEKSDAKEDADSVYVYVKGKDGKIFMYTCQAAAAPGAVKDLLKWAEKRAK